MSERIYAVMDYWDGACSGVADFEGRPHAFGRVFDRTTDDWTDRYLLKPLNAREFEVVIQDREIWLRWRAAYDAGNATIESHPALPEDAEAHARIADEVAEAVRVPDDSVIVATGQFSKDSVVWTRRGR
jgi:hypothetical protein